MKHFSSSILSFNKANKNDRIVTLESFKDNNFNYRTILEFNEMIAKQDETCSRNYYMALIDHIKGHISNFDPAYTAIFNYYDAVSSAVKGMLSATNMCRDDHYDLERQLGELVQKFKKDKSGNVIKFVGFSKTPINSDSTTILMPIRNYCNNVINNLKADKYTAEPKDIVADICRFVSKANGIGECNSVEEYIHNYTNYFEFRELEVLPSTADNLMYSVMETNGNIYMCAADLDGYALCDVMISMLKTSTDKFENPNTLKSIVQNLCDGLVTYAHIIAKSRDVNETMRAKIMQANIASLTSSLNGIVKEGMEMFGDEINADDLFADLTDFQPSMFRNIDLEADSEFLIAKKHIARHAMAMEAQYIAEGRYEDLPLIEAAVAEKTKDAISNLLEAIRTMMGNFISNIQNNAKKETAFLTQHKDVILNNPLDPNTQLTMYGRVPEGYERLKKGFKIPVLKFDELKEQMGKEGVDPEAAFFEQHIKEYVGQDFKRSEKRSLADDLKYYWGFKDGNKYDNYSVGDLPNIQEMYSWLTDTVNIASNLNIQAKNVDRTYNEYKRGKKTEDTKAQAERQNADNQQKQPVNASYYSYIYQRDMLISEMDIKGNTQQDEKAIQNASNNQSTQQQTNNQNQQKSGESTDKMITRNMTTYCKVCRQVLSARATAFAYIHNEFMDICRYIVKNHGGDTAKKADTQPAQQSSTTTNKEK